MKTMTLSGLLCLSLSLFVSSADAQTTAVRSGTVPVEGSAPTAGKLRGGALPVLEEEGDVAGAALDADREVVDLQVDVRSLERGGICFDIHRIDSTAGHLFLVFFAHLDELGFQPIAVVDAETEDQRSFSVDLDVFAGLTMAVMALRLDDDGHVDAGPMEKAAAIAGRAGR